MLHCNSQSNSYTDISACLKYFHVSGISRYASGCKVLPEAFPAVVPNSNILYGPTLSRRYRSKKRKTNTVAKKDEG